MAHERRSALTDDLRVLVDRIPAEGEHVDVEIPVPEVASILGENLPFELAAPAKLVADLHTVGRVVHVRGKLSAMLRSPCGRCLEPVSYPVGGRFEVAYFPAGEEPEPNEEGEVADDAMEVATYHANKVDLRQMVHDQIFLEAPMNPTCEVTPAGKCAGYDEKVLSAEVTETPPGKLWKALKDIKLDQN